MIALVVAVALASVEPAPPCPRDGFRLESLLVGGATVPTNVVWIGPALPVDITRLWWIREWGTSGAVVWQPTAMVFDADHARVSSIDALRPDTDYVAVLASAGAQPADADADLWFRTASGPDEEPPAPPSVLGWELIEQDEQWGILGPMPASTRVRIFLDTMSDVRGFRLERIDDIGHVVLAGAMACARPAETTASLVAHEPEPTTHGVQRYRVVTLDEADNRSATVIELDLGPQRVPVPDDDAGGCASAAPSPSSPLGAVMLALLALRRRRSHA